VIARNQHLSPTLRSALARLENGIRDVKPEDIQAIIRQDLGPKLETYSVKVAPTILSEASVSAVVRFSWRNPQSGRRERGVFKVLKPHIPEYFSEDMEYLQGLAQHFGKKRPHPGFSSSVIPDTFLKVRRLLKHEVDFVREQKTLVEAWKLYQSMPGVRVPQLMQPLCTPRITAMTEEHGIKVTSAAARLPSDRRRKIAEQLIEALVALPLLSARPDEIFHGDPHAGNLLYNNQTGKLIMLDWALRERLSRDLRRHLALLFLMVSLRDPVGTCNEIFALSQQAIRKSSPQGRMVGELVTTFLNEVPVKHIPSTVDAMRLLERIAVKGIRFPVSLIMLSKVILTLDGVLGDVGGSTSRIGLSIARHVAQHWIANWAEFRSPLTTKDWITLQCSAWLYPSRLWLQCEEAILDRLVPPPTSDASTGTI
jgi:predicted unusual protein kinase regulating ubiquinone biosynthesis (AarF/ABC1/UbiB family)